MKLRDLLVGVAIPWCLSSPAAAQVGTVCSQPGMVIDGSSVHADTLTVINATTISDVDVGVNISHTAIGNLVIEVIHNATATTLRLQEESFLGVDDIVLTYDDQGEPYGAIPFNSGGAMQPYDLCDGSGIGLGAAFSGLSALSDWTITIEDTLPVADDGVLNEWCITIFNAPIAPQPGPLAGLACFVTPGLNLQAEWSNGGVYDTINVYLDGVLDVTLPGTDEAVTISGAGLTVGQTYEICVEPQVGGVVACGAVCCQVIFLAGPTPGDFLRGDANDDGSTDIADAIGFLSWWIGGPPPGCRDAWDFNDDGGLNVADAAYLLSALFQGSTPPPPPSWSACGPDPTADNLDCAGFNGCP
ncbi:MAG: hypothetical protein ACE5GW_04160 [Planctomycetota bacterium]